MGGEVLDIGVCWPARGPSTGKPLEVPSRVLSEIRVLWECC